MSISSVKKACREFIDADDTSSDLIEDLRKLQSIKSNVGDRIAKVIIDLGVVRNIFKNHDQRQKVINRPPLQEVASFLENIRTFDFEHVEQEIEEGIQAL
jgi:hypothetical protein